LYIVGVDILSLQSAAQLSLHLKSLRRSRSLTQADMAARLQVTQERYSQIERHPELVATGRLLEILAILGVDVLLKVRPVSTRDSTPTPLSVRDGEDW
jgi:HTH-type transcriptional regulator/antitoxin HipB